MYELWLDTTSTPVLRHITTNRGWYPAAGLKNTVAAFESQLDIAWDWPPILTPIQRIAILDTVEDFFFLLTTPNTLSKGPT